MTFDWNKAKETIIKILQSNLAQDDKKQKVESLLEVLPFEYYNYSLENYNISYCKCGYPSWMASDKRPREGWKIRELLDKELTPDNDIEWICPFCNK